MTRHDITKRGILAGFVLEKLSEDYISLLQEQETETKPSRISNKIFKNKNKKNRKDRDDFDD